MRIIIDEADNTQWRMSIFDCTDPEDLNIANLLCQTLDFNFTYIQRNHGCAAQTITDLVENINDGC